MSSIRRNVRLRKEYLYRKSLEGKQRDDYERKQRVKRALAGELSGWPSVCVPGAALVREMRVDVNGEGTCGSEGDVPPPLPSGSG